MYYLLRKRLPRIIITLVTVLLFSGAVHAPLRSVYEMGILKYYPWLIMLFMLFVAPLFVMRQRVGLFDRSVMLYFVLVSISFLINEFSGDGSTEIGMWILYALPVSVYFVFAHLQIGDNDVRRIIVIMALIVAGVTIVEFFFQNVLGETLFDHGGMYDISSVGARYVFWGSTKFVRARGATRYAQSSGCLHAAMVLYFMYSYLLQKYLRTNKEQNKFAGLNTIHYSSRICLSAAIVSLIALYLTGSGTGLLVLFVGCFTIFVFHTQGYVLRKRMIGFGVFFLVGIFLFTVDLSTMSGYYEQGVVVVLSALRNYVSHFSPALVLHYLFGFGQVSSYGSVFSSETHLFNELVQIGIVSFSFYIIMLYQYLKMVFALEWKNKNNSLQYFLVVSSLFVGSVHYECVFVYPLNIVFFMMIGLTVRQYKISQELIGENTNKNNSRFLSL